MFLRNLCGAFRLRLGRARTGDVGRKRPTEARSWVTLSAKASARVSSDERMLEMGWVVVNLVSRKLR